MTFTFVLLAQGSLTYSVSSVLLIRRSRYCIAIVTTIDTEKKLLNKENSTWGVYSQQHLIRKDRSILTYSTLR